MSFMFRPLRADEIECRVQSAKKSGLVLLLYKDARCDQNILDETVGPFNWRREHSRDNANCTVSIWDKDKGQWISKEDTGTESNTEAQKGLASDSFKRACFNWGIGRELYTAPLTWVKSADCNIKDGSNGKFVCYDRFAVKEIEYSENGTVTKLIITNTTTGRDCFWYKKSGPTAPADPQKAMPTPYKPSFTCDRCGNRITPTIGKNGEEISAEMVADTAKKRFNGIYCADCQRALMEARARNGGT